LDPDARDVLDHARTDLGAAVPFALTNHIDTLGPNGVIQTVQFTDGLKRAVQTKMDAAAASRRRGGCTA
jgi:hypothetical protein